MSLSVRVVVVLLIYGVSLGRAEEFIRYRRFYLIFLVESDKCLGSKMSRQ